MRLRAVSPTMWPTLRSSWRRLLKHEELLLPIDSESISSVSCRFVMD